jgi:hypothetical protein
MKYIALILPAIIIILCLPMLLGLIGPNSYYGFRTAKTMSSSNIWYAANRSAAINMIIASGLSLAVGWVITQRGVQPGSNLLISVIATSVLEGIAVIVSLAQVSRL